MNHDSSPDSGLPIDGSPPSEAWLFAQVLLGKPLPRIVSPEAKARAKREELERLAPFSTRHAEELRGLQAAEAAARNDRKLWEWCARISTRAEETLRAMLCQEAAEREAWRRAERFVEAHSTGMTEWNEVDHPRQPKGASDGGRWVAKGSGGGGASSGSSGQGVTHDTPTLPVQSPATKPHLPADYRGTWIYGTKGDGVFRYNNSIENQLVGVAGKEVNFKNQHIAVGGFPPEVYYGGSKVGATVEINTVTGTRADNLAADAAMRAKLGDPMWQRPNGFVWNHAGQPGSKAMELVEKQVHRAVGHKGPAAEPRAVRRAAGARGVTGRAMGALTVYLVARDVLQAAGVLKPDYTVEEWETYQFVAEDGSVFVVSPAGWFSSAQIEFVAGPRKGQTEKITNAEVDEYRKQAEEEWGKYIPGGPLSEPRFIPGTKRKTLPWIIHRYGVPYDAGWIDEEGIHRYSVMRAQYI